MHIFKTRHFQRWMRKTELSDAALCKAVQEMTAGLIDADPQTCCCSPPRIWMRPWPTAPCWRSPMTEKAKSKSRLMEVVHEGACDLHRLGFIDKRKMRKYDLLCLEPVRDYDAARIKALRARLQLSQAVLASVLNTSASTVRKWEVGDKRPSGPSQKLLDLIERKGLEAVL